MRRTLVATLFLGLFFANTKPVSALFYVRTPLDWEDSSMTIFWKLKPGQNPTDFARYLIGVYRISASLETEVTELICRSNDLAVPEWGLNGKVNHRQIPAWQFLLVDKSGMEKLSKKNAWKTSAVEWRHPELRKGEVFLTNACTARLLSAQFYEGLFYESEYQQIGWKTKRLGQQAYNIDGEPAGECLLPVFVQRTELEKAKITIEGKYNVWIPLDK